MPNVKRIHLSPRRLQYNCAFCGKTSVKRVVAGIWDCRRCRKTLAGGAYLLATPAAATVRSNTIRLRKAQEDA